MSEILTGILLVLLGAGGFWVYSKLNRNKATEAAREELGSSKAEDDDRTEITSDIADQIEKNKELQDKIKDRLGKNEEN